MKIIKQINIVVQHISDVMSTSLVNSWLVKFLLLHEHEQKTFLSGPKFIEIFILFRFNLKIYINLIPLFKVLCPCARNSEKVNKSTMY